MAYVSNGEPRRETMVGVPVTYEEREFLRLAAKEADTSISDIMRKGGFAEAQRRIGEARHRQAEAKAAAGR